MKEGFIVLSCRLSSKSLEVKIFKQGRLTGGIDLKCLLLDYIATNFKKMRESRGCWGLMQSVINMLRSEDVQSSAPKRRE